MEGNIEVKHPEVIESLFMVCPNMVKHWKAFNESKESKEFRKHNVDPLKEQLKDHLSRSKKSGETGVIDLFDYFTTVSSHSLELPPNITPEVLDKLGDVSYRHYWHPFSHAPVARLGLGLFITELNQQMQQKVSGESKKKFILYSAHDSTVGPLMAALHVGDQKWPPYASSFAIELFQANNQSLEPHAAASHANSDYYVRFLYQNKPVTFKGYEFAPLELVQNHMKPLIPNDWQKECTENIKAQQ
jgi:hypothetical protein